MSAIVTESLASELGVSPESLQAIGVFRRDRCWLIPERDATGEVIGQAKRFDDGRKRFVTGGRRGLTYAMPFHRYAGSSMCDPVFVVEGMSDVAAGLSMGLDIVGRPSASGGVEHLIEFLRDRHVCIFAENDDAGKTGAKSIAEKLAGVVSTLRIVSPPSQYKDLRAWYAAPDGIDKAGLLELVADLPDFLINDALNVPVSLSDLIRRYQCLRPPVIDGLLRIGETMNIIASPKVGKSWLMYDLLCSIATGRRWLNAFDCIAGPVLLIDNELHSETLAHRLSGVVSALGIDQVGLADMLDILPLRGKGVTLDHLAPYIARIQAGYYKVIVLDAWYRFIPAGSSENSNADVMGLYNLLDQFAEQAGAAFIAVHHASKGSQGDKRVTDVGAGAGAQSRAADTHVVLRAHEDEGCVVMEAAVRSFEPVEPLALRWDFPRWHRADDLDTGALKDRKTKQERRNDERLAEGVKKVWDALEAGSLTPRKLREATGFGKSRLDTVLDKMVAAGKLEYEETAVSGNQTRLYRRLES